MTTSANAEATLDVLDGLGRHEHGIDVGAGSTETTSAETAVEEDDNEGYNPNPLGEVLETISDGVYYECTEIIESEFGDNTIENETNVGIEDVRTEDGKSLLRWRPATDEECATWKPRFHLDIKVDVRKNIPKQFSAIMRNIARRALDVAEALLKVDDDRDRKSVKKIVSEGIQGNPVGRYAVVDADRFVATDMSLAIAHMVAEERTEAFIVAIVPGLGINHEVYEEMNNNSQSGETGEEEPETV